VSLVARKPSPLERAIRQKKPFRSRRQACVVALLLTGDRMRRRLFGVVEAHHITLQQYNVLRILRGAGEDGMPTLEIGSRMIEKTPGITRLMDRLERKGLVRRRRCPRDRRQILCWIETPGLELLEALEEPLQAAEDASLAALSPKRLEALVELLNTVRETLEGGGTPSRSVVVPRGREGLLEAAHSKE
jgi:DNA-binding MarR family transcriptional regulator